MRLGQSDVAQVPAQRHVGSLVELRPDLGEALVTQLREQPVKVSTACAGDDEIDPLFTAYKAAVEVVFL